MAEPSARRVAGVVSNLFAALFGLGSAWLAGFGGWALLWSPVAGTLGWFFGAWIGGMLAKGLRGRGYGPTGLAGYRLMALPPDEISAGGKARALAMMLRAGHPVPDGFVILPCGFTGETLTAAGNDILHEQIARFPTGQRFAVRSSALNEDSASASFAGAYDSVLDVLADGLRDALAAVRRSRLAGRLDAYAAATGSEAGELAVIVQAMVPAELAGVVFTVDPFSGDLGKMYGNMVHGAGEALVSGAAPAAEFTLTRPAADYTGPESLRPHASRLHALAHLVEGGFGGVAQDIEWAVADGRLWLLQSRPISTMNPWQARTAERNDSLAGNCLWSATNLSEANPEPQTPLTISWMAYQQANGGPSMALRGREMAGSIGGRPYANLTVQLTAQLGRKPKVSAREAYRRLAGWWGELPEAVSIPLLPLTADDWRDAGPKLLRTLVQMAAARARLPEYVGSNPSRCLELSGRIAGCGTPAELGELWQRELLPHSLRSFWAVIAAGSEGPARLEAELREQFGAADASALMSNLSGLVGELASLGPVAGLHAVLAGGMSREQYVAQFGHRGVNEAELAWPRPAEDPGWLDRLLAEAADGVPVATLRGRQEATYRAALDRISALAPSLARQAERRLVKAARQAARREAARSEGVRSIGVMRRFALRAGELLGLGDGVFYLTVPELLSALAGEASANGLIGPRRETHARYQSLPPLPGLILGRFDPFEWAADPARRQDYYVAGTVAQPAETSIQPERELRGHPGASGRVTGRVRRIDDFADAGSLKPGEILVTQLTNIGWTPIFPKAGGVVTDLGAPLSHAAIVARELGVPAVVGCGDATTRLRTGDLVEVDGALGVVRLLERA